MSCRVLECCVRLSVCLYIHERPPHHPDPHQQGHDAEPLGLARGAPRRPTTTTAAATAAADPIPTRGRGSGRGRGWGAEHPPPQLPPELPAQPLRRQQPEAAGGLPHPHAGVVRQGAGAAGGPPAADAAGGLRWGCVECGGCMYVGKWLGEDGRVIDHPFIHPFIHSSIRPSHAPTYAYPYQPTPTPTPLLAFPNH